MPSKPLHPTAGRLPLAAAALLSLFLTAATTLAAGPGDSPPNADALLQHLRQAIIDLDGDRMESCRGHLTAVTQAAPANSIYYLIARRIQYQLDGGYRERQAVWWDRRVVDQVVLVPDEVSFIEAIAAWPADRFWPVLIEDHWFAPLFVEAFAPSRVVRWRSANAPGSNSPAAEYEKRTITPLAATIKLHNEAFAVPAIVPPPGLVVIDPHAGQRCAGLALALGRGQPVMLLKAPDGRDRTAPLARVEQFNEQLMTALAHLGMVRSESWAAVTLAGEFAWSYTVPGEKFPKMSVDDRLGRDANLIRHAVIGRLFGDQNRSVYMAMCSLFLRPEQALLVNTYRHWPVPDPEGKNAYHLTHAAKTLAADPALRVTILQNAGATHDAFDAHARPVPDHGLFWVTSAFGSWVLKFPEGDGLKRMDMPVGRPLIVQMVASYGAENPWNPNELCRTLLDGGTYWFYGAIDEPYLQAFVVPTQLARRAAPGTPLLFASKQMTGHPFAKPWKLTLLGDPLMTLRDAPVERLPADPPVGSTSVSDDSPGPDASPVDRIRAALARGRPIDPADARTALADSASLTDGELTHVVRALAIAGDHAPLAAMTLDEMRRPPVNSVWAQRAMLAEFDAAMERNDSPTAIRCLDAMSAVNLDSDRYLGRMKRWVESSDEPAHVRDAAARMVRWRAAANSEDRVNRINAILDALPRP